MNINQQIKMFIELKGSCYYIRCTDKCIFNNLKQEKFCLNANSMKNRYDYALNIIKYILLEKYI